ncbi:LANO_0G13806g1_1 [Lachancea nothofagi CBS 11611]|uniref:LANO_0G13806g1_1 n=1 Tax=Lachancea nothofagi CBS 11611 TaxID=1266666 RepID=A0A1G4KK00_9SACH|nr:LANO_0G13806g1_1 [Lachancea nothofagi CBS 11611]
MYATHMRFAFRGSFRGSFRHFSAAAEATPKPKRPFVTKRRVLLVAGASATAYALTDDTTQNLLKHIGLTSKRVGVAAQATVRCVYNYQRVLSGSYHSEDERHEALSQCHQLCANITLRALETNGGIFIKLGQHIAAMTYLLPAEWTETMIPLQDKCPQSTHAEIVALFKQDLKQNMDDIFTDFDPHPIGVASLAQVHIATLKSTGQKVAVKIQHPALKEFVPIDVLLTQTVFNVVDSVFPEYPLGWLGDELQNSIYVELDFTKEARNARRTAEYFADYIPETALRIPKVVRAHKRVLIMEYLGGHRLDDLAYIDKNRISRAEVSSCLSHIFNNMIFTPNVGIHCDPHGGNLAIRHIERSRGHHNFEIILYDHGLYRHPTTEMRRDYAKFWLALLDRDDANMKKYAMKFANIDEDQFPLFAAAITGRSIDAARSSDLMKPRSDDEIKVMAKAITEGSLLGDLMTILCRVPRIVLLILKTNDLTRHLDECLQSPLSVERTFLIMTQYCARTVYDETRQNINFAFPRWSFTWICKEFKAWWDYEKRMNQLILYDLGFWFRNRFLNSR